MYVEYEVEYTQQLILLPIVHNYIANYIVKPIDIIIINITFNTVYMYDMLDDGVCFFYK